jgi:hypothetical protein
MPSRVAEAILNKEMCVEGKKRLAGWEKRAGQFADIGDLPFLSIETDGMPFPQIIEANLETFILQARRLHDKLVSVRASHGRRFFRHLPIVRLYEIVARNTRQILVSRLEK